MKINDDIATEWWMDYLSGNLTDSQKSELEQYLLEQPELAEELHAQADIWSSMENLEKPEPSPAMDERFEAMLAGYQQAAPKRMFRWELLSLWLKNNWQVGFSALAIGLLIGVFFINGPDQDVANLSAEVLDMKKMLMLTMIEKDQPQDRIKAVNLTREISKADSKVIHALISALNQDQSINVRLAALEALVPYGAQSTVREALIRSIATQDSPLLQVALADAMIILQEKSAVESFSKMIESDTVNESVKSKLKSTIETLRSI